MLRPMAERVLKFEIAVVGGGPAGLAAACVAAESGRRVVVVEAAPWPGGQIWRSDGVGEARSLGQARLESCTRVRDVSRSGALGDGPPALPGEALRWLSRLGRSGVTFLDCTTVIAVPFPRVLLAEREERPMEIHWEQLILATGARELFLPFPGWTLPGVMGPGG